MRRFYGFICTTENRSDSCKYGFIKDIITQATFSSAKLRDECQDIVEDIPPFFVGAQRASDAREVSRKKGFKGFRHFHSTHDFKHYILDAADELK